MRRRVLPLIAVVALTTGAFALPAPAAIHELVSSHCAGHDLPTDAPVDPPGQIRFGEQSFLRALLATGVYDEPIFGADPEGNPGPFVTIVINDHPANKFSWDGETYDEFFEPELGVTVFIPAIVPDHPSLANCHKLQT